MFNSSHQIDELSITLFLLVSALDAYQIQRDTSDHSLTTIKQLNLAVKQKVASLDPKNNHLDDAGAFCLTEAAIRCINEDDQQYFKRIENDLKAWNVPKSELIKMLKTASMRVTHVLQQESTIYPTNAMKP